MTGSPARANGHLSPALIELGHAAAQRTYARRNMTKAVERMIKFGTAEDRQYFADLLLHPEQCDLMAG